MVLQQLLPTVREPSEALAGGGHFHDSGIPEVSDVSTYLLAGCVAGRLAHLTSLMVPIETARISHLVSRV